MDLLQSQAPAEGVLRGVECSRIKSKEQGARSKEQRAKSKEQRAKSKEQGARSKEYGVSNEQ